MTDVGIGWYLVLLLGGGAAGTVLVSVLNGSLTGIGSITANGGSGLNNGGGNRKSTHVRYCVDYNSITIWTVLIVRV